MKNTLLLIGLFLLLMSASAQNNVGINTTPDPSAVLDISATDKGLLILRMTETEMNAITTPATSLMVFNITANAFWYWDGSQWTEFRSGTSLWTLSGTAIDVSDTTYKVGIGTSNPSGKFEVATINHTGSYGSDVAAGGTANASEEYPGQPASLAFDDSPTTYWSNNNNLPSWIGYDLGAGNEKRVARYHIAYNSVVTSDNSPNDWTFEGSNDGASWTVLDTQTGQGWTATGIKTYDFSNTTHYRYYRLNITDNKGIANDFVSVYEIEMKEETLTSQSTFSVSENGAIRISDGNEADGKILVSDASGNANWADGATVNGGGWTVNGNYIFNTNDSVGIGTATPGAALEVVGHISQTGTGWSVFLGEGAGTSDDLTDNKNVFVGFESAKSNTSGALNVAVGYHSLFNNTTGSGNTANGSSSLYSNTEGYENTATGFEALYTNSTGCRNTAFGVGVLYSNTTGSFNTSNGYQSLNNNTVGDRNTSNGYRTLYTNTSGSNNIAIGHNALYLNNTGSTNIAIGINALGTNVYASSLVAIGDSSLYNNTSGSGNTAIGSHSLFSNTTADGNTALGSYTLFSNTTGISNTASGQKALMLNTTGNYNTAYGHWSLRENTTGSSNTAIGNYTLTNNTSGIINTAVGDSVLYRNTTGMGNIAIGNSTMHNNSMGYLNAAVGNRALYHNGVGNYNVACGNYSLYNNTTGASNTANGPYALLENTTGYHNAAYGNHSLFKNTTGYYNTAAGSYATMADTNFTNSTAIGYYSTASASNTIRLGNSSVTTIGGFADWTNVSDGRFKTNVQENVSGLDFILKLRPVTYNLNMDAIAAYTRTPDSLRLTDGERLKGAEVQIGFIAQEVEAAADALGFDFHGVDKPKNKESHYGLRYAEFVAPLVKAVQELDAENQQLVQQLAGQQKLIEALEKRIENLERK